MTLNDDNFLTKEDANELSEMTQHQKLDVLVVKVAKMEVHVENMNGLVKSHEKRIRKNEKFKYKSMGGMGVLGAILIIITILSYLGVMGGG